MAPENPIDVNRIWQGQPTEGTSMSLDEMRDRVRRMKKKGDWRNAREYAGAALLLVLVAVFGAREHNVTVLIGSGLMALAAVYVVYHLHRFGTVRRMPPDIGLRDCLDFHRTELVRQRDLLRSVWWWYLLPFVPGAALIFIGRAIERPDRRVLGAVGAVVFAATFVGVGLLNAWGARKIQRAIDTLDQAR